MAKYLFLGINSLLVVFFNFFAGDDVTLQHNLPAAMDPGSEFVAEFTITKSIAIQFGKLQLDLPLGITASEADSRGGQFSYSDNHAKIIWMQIPSDNEVKVKIKLQAGKEASGSKTITAKFFYVVGNEKKSVEIPSHDITIGSGTPAAVTSTGTAGDTAAFTRPEEPGTAVTAVRTITKDAASGNFRVDIRIKKDGIKGFAKYHDVLPDGLLAMKGEASGGGSFKFADKKATIIWATLPKDETITASYWIKATRKFSVNPKVSGTFSYLENETTMKVNAADEVVPVVAAEAVVSNTNPDTTQETVSTNTVATNTVVNTATVEPTNTVTPTNTVAPTNTVMPETGTGVSNASVNFHIQIGAYKNAPQTTYFSSKFNISDNISTDMQNGLTKFIVGKFSEYKASRDYREEIKARGVSDAFVTAYNAGRRITVQEALMIVKQKWFR